MTYGQNPYPQQNQPFGGSPYGPPAGSQGSAPWPGQPGAQPQNPGQPGRPGWGQQPGWPGGQPGQPAPGQPQQQGAPWGPPQGAAQSAPGGWGPGGQQPPAPVPATPVPEPEPRKASLRTRELLVSTTETLPGHEVAAVLGEVVGVITRPRQLRPAPDLAALLAQTRQDAVDAAVAMAQQAGADAIIGLRFDGGKVNDQTSEVAAYGTAVTLVGGNPLQAAASEPEDEQDENPFTTGGSSIAEQPAQPAGAQPEQPEQPAQEPS